MIALFHRPTGVKPKPWMGGFGILGLTGFTAIPLNYPTFLVFFCFFGFFSFFWWGKVDFEQPDERLVENQRRAVSIAYRLGIGINFIGVLLATRYVTVNSYIAFQVLIAIVCFSVAISTILEAYLIYRYEQMG